MNKWVEGVGERTGHCIDSALAGPVAEIPGETSTVRIPGATWHWETAAGAEAPCC